MWAFESISYVALNTRMGLLTDRPDPSAALLAQHMSDFFNYSFKYDVQPSIWPYYKTPGFKKFLETYDQITEITTNYIETAIERFKQEEQHTGNKCVLEQLLALNKQVAVVMAMDMLMAGLDTVGNTWNPVGNPFDTFHGYLFADLLSLCDYSVSSCPQSRQANAAASRAAAHFAQIRGRPNR